MENIKALSRFEKQGLNAHTVIHLWLHLIKSTYDVLNITKLYGVC